MDYRNLIAIITIILLLLNIIIMFFMLLKSNHYIERYDSTILIVIMVLVSAVTPSIIIGNVFNKNYEVTYKGNHEVYAISFDEDKATVTYIDGESMKSKDIRYKDIKLVDGNSYVECEKREYKFLNNGDGDIELYLSKEYKPTDMTSITK